MYIWEIFTEPLKFTRVLEGSVYQCRSALKVLAEVEVVVYAAAICDIVDAAAATAAAAAAVVLLLLLCILG